MSLIRDPATITKVGRQMMTAGGDITYTKATLYGQDISHLTKDQLESLTSIGSPLMTVPVGISDKSVNGSATTIVLEATFQNSNLKADLPYTAVGFFAKKGDDEKLVLVGIADPGAYLVATPPDGIATDAFDIKVAISIGDAASVTAVVDPAGSVTPATLNGAINKATHDLTAQIDTKADKTTVEQELAIKANSTDVDKKLDTKANSSDVYTKKQVDDAFSSRDATIATKADKATVDAEIAKIDFTPYAKTADVNNEIKTVTDLANSKVGTDYSYSKAELDKKLLAISTDADGKVDAGQVADMITSKADKLDTYTKAEVDSKVTDAKNTAQSSVDNLNIVKADKSNTYTKAEVDSRVNDAKSTAQASDNQIWGDVNKLKGARTVDKPDFNDLTDFGIYYVSNPSSGQNQPNDSWGTLIISNGNGHRIVQTYYPDSGDSPFFRMKVDANWQPWRQMAKMDDIVNLQNNINTQVQDAKNTAQVSDNQIWNAVNLLTPNNQCPALSDGFDLNSQFVGWRRSPNRNLKNMPSGWTTDSMYYQGTIDNGDGLFELALNIGQNANDIPRLAYRTYAWGKWKPWSIIANDSDITTTITTGFNWNSASPTNETRFITNAWLVDQQALHGAVDRMNNLQNQINTKLDASTFNSRVNTASTTYLRLNNTSDWNTIFGVPNGNNVLSSLRVDGTAPGPLLNNFSAGVGFGGGDTKGVLTVAYSDHQARISGGNGSAPVWSEDIAWKSDVNNLQNQVNDLINQINYIKQNYLQGKRFPASQEAQAQAWENANPNGIAMIEK